MELRHFVERIHQNWHALHECIQPLLDGLHSTHGLETGCDGLNYDSTGPLLSLGIDDTIL